MADDFYTEQARALQFVWSSILAGDCPNCHEFHEPIRDSPTQQPEGWKPQVQIPREQRPGIHCPHCGFRVLYEEIAAIQEMTAKAKREAVGVFEAWVEARVLGS